MSCLNKLQKAQDLLPVGHIGIREAEKAVEKEYGACKLIEKKWMKHKAFKNNRLMTLIEANELVSCLSKEFGERRVPRIISPSVELRDYSAGHYDARKKEIHLRSSINTSTLIHEFAHFLQYQNDGFFGGHGKDFCELLELCFQASVNVLKSWKEKESFV